VILKARRWGSESDDCVICIHGLAQHGGVFQSIADRLVEHGCSVVAVDLRGHGESGPEPPWNTEIHAQDVLETLDDLQIDSATLIGHSFGGRVTATLAADSPDRVRRVVLLDPALEVSPEWALKSAEIERLDWSFATVDGAVTALLSSESMVAPSRDTVAAYVRDDVREGPDGRYRFRFCPSAAVVAWNEATLSAPAIAELPTLFVHADRSFLDGAAQERRYREVLDGLLTFETVPHGHNVLWESPTETLGAIVRFMDSAVPGTAS
jgi:lipase